MDSRGVIVKGVQPVFGSQRTGLKARLIYPLYEKIKYILDYGAVGSLRLHLNSMRGAKSGREFWETPGHRPMTKSITESFLTRRTPRRVNNRDDAACQLKSGLLDGLLTPLDR